MPLPGCAFVGNELHEREVEMPDGSRVTIHFRKARARTYAKYSLAIGSQDADVRGDSMAVVVADTVCEPDGALSLTYEQARDLDPRAMANLFHAAVDVSGYGEKEKKA